MDPCAAQDVETVKISDEKMTFILKYTYVIIGLMPKLTSYKEYNYEKI